MYLLCDRSLLHLTFHLAQDGFAEQINLSQKTFPLKGYYFHYSDNVSLSKSVPLNMVILDKSKYVEAEPSPTQQTQDVHPMLVYCLVFAGHAKSKGSIC